MSDDRDELLRRILLGDQVDPAERAALEADPEYAQRLVELLEIVRELETASAEERELIEAGVPSPSVPPPGAASSAGSPPPGPRPPGTRPPGWVAAVAALLLALGFWLTLGRDREAGAPVAVPDNVMLGDSAIQGLELVLSDDGARFSWSFELPPGWSFRVHVTHPKTGVHVDALARSKATEWRVSAERLRSFPPMIEWRVTALDRLGVERASRTALSRAQPD